MAMIARVVAGVFTFALFGFTTALAQDHGSLEEAQAMAEAAAQHLEEAGDAALADFNTDPAWRDRDLYVFVFAPDGTCLAHGANNSLVGVLFYGLFFSAIQTGALGMELITDVPSEIALVLQGVLVLVIVASREALHKVADRLAVRRRAADAARSESTIAHYKT